MSTGDFGIVRLDSRGMGTQSAEIILRPLINVLKTMV